MHTITLTTDHLNIVGAALAELPLKIAHPVWTEIQKQLAKAAAETKPEDASEAA